MDSETSPSSAPPRTRELDREAALLNQHSEDVRRRRLKSAWTLLVAAVFVGVLASERKDGFAALRRPLVLAFGRPGRAKILGHETTLEFRAVRHMMRFEYVGRSGRAEGVTQVPWREWNRVQTGDGVAIHFVPGWEKGRFDWAFLDDDLGFSRGQFLRLGLVIIFGAALLVNRCRALDSAKPSSHETVTGFQ